MTQLLRWCFWISLLEQFKNKKQLFVVLKKTAITLILSNNFNDSRRKKLCFIPFSKRIFRNRCLAVSDLCHIFTIHWTLYIPLSHIKQCIFFNKVTHEIDRKWVVAPFSNIYGKIELVFHLTHKIILYKRLNFQVKWLRILTGKKHP